VQEGNASANREPDSFDPYVGQILLVRSLYDRGDWKGTYLVMNRFMDMLEPREGGMPVQPANELFTLRNFVTPPDLHDVTRPGRPLRIEQPRMSERAQRPG
jgi:hypothetical protein